MTVDTRHPQFEAYSEAWDSACERVHSPLKNLAYNDYRAKDAANLADMGEFGGAIALLNKIGNLKYEEKHAGHLIHIKRSKSSTPCTPGHALIGGGCVNCGWNP